MTTRDSRFRRLLPVVLVAVPAIAIVVACVIVVIWWQQDENAVDSNLADLLARQPPSEPLIAKTDAEIAEVLIGTWSYEFVSSWGADSKATVSFTDDGLFCWSWKFSGVSAPKDFSQNGEWEVSKGKIHLYLQINLKGEPNGAFYDRIHVKLIDRDMLVFALNISKELRMRRRDSMKP